MRKRPNDVPHRRAFKKAFGRSPKAGFHIHHIDGNWSNNDPSNLLEVTPLEHYQIHKRQGDWGACVKLASVAKVPMEELVEMQRLHGLRCVELKVGIHSDEHKSKFTEQMKQMWKTNPPGRKPVTNGTDIVKFKTEQEVEAFLNEHPDWRKGYPDDVKKGLSLSKRRITSEESKQIAQKRLESGNHNFTVKHTCPHCGKEGKGPMMFRWHYDNCKQKSVDSESVSMYNGDYGLNKAHDKKYE